MGGTSSKNVPPLPVKKPCTIDGYILDRPIGEGGFGKVWQAQRPAAEGSQWIAMKIQNMKDVDDTFLREISFPDLKHKNIVLPIGGTFGSLLNPEEQTCLAEKKYNPATAAILEMPLAASDLFRMMSMTSHGDRENASPQKVSILLDILCGLENLHNKGIIYADLKPENILLDDKYRAQLADFGLFSTTRARLSHCLRGSFSYFAPEQWLSKKNCTTKIDIWALGILIAKLFFNWNIIDDKKVIEAQHPLLVSGFSKEFHKDALLYFISLFDHLGVPTEEWINKYVEPAKKKAFQEFVSAYGREKEKKKTFGPSSPKESDFKSNTPLGDLFLILKRDMLQIDPKNREDVQTLRTELVKVFHSKRKCDLGDIPSVPTFPLLTETGDVKKIAEIDKQVQKELSIDKKVMSEISSSAFKLMSRYASLQLNPEWKNDLPLLYAICVWIVVALNFILSKDLLTHLLENFKESKIPPLQLARVVIVTLKHELFSLSQLVE
jgi:serine/threonine protein kinase